MSPSPTSPESGGVVSQRATHLALIGVMAIAFVCFLVGIDDGVPHPAEPGPAAATDVPDDGAVPSMTYAEIRSARFGPNRDWAVPLAALASPAPTTTIPPPTPEAKRAALRLRSERRAFNGAPPVVPHRVDQLSDAHCMTCHESGLRVAARPADRLPHPYLANCQQCHVAAAAHDFDPFVLAENRFRGMPAPFEGPRAWAGAPPQVPHSTFMRDNCLSCHGPGGKPGLRTTHPERQSCLQCHAPSAALNHAITAQGPPMLPPPVIEGP